MIYLFIIINVSDSNILSFHFIYIYLLLCFTTMVSSLQYLPLYIGPPIYVCRNIRAFILGLLMTFRHDIFFTLSVKESIQYYFHRQSKITLFFVMNYLLVKYRLEWSHYIESSPVKFWFCWIIAISATFTSVMWRWYASIRERHSTFIIFL